MRARTIRALCLVGVGVACLFVPAVAEEAKTISFAEGAWDASKWTPLRLVEHETTAMLVQKPDSVGTNSFTDEQKKKHLDNVLLMTDSGTTEGELEVTFRIGPEKGAAPGVFLSPTVEGEVLQSAIAVFVADYTMAVWRATVDAESGKTEYAHLVRLARYSKPGATHTLRCRYSKARKSVALQLDDSDVVVLRFPAHEINSRLGIWGCHGTCDFFSLKMTPGGTLPWSGEAPE